VAVARYSQVRKRRENTNDSVIYPLPFPCGADQQSRMIDDKALVVNAIVVRRLQSVLPGFVTYHSGSLFDVHLLLFIN
jgi:hypothetical protein